MKKEKAEVKKLLKIIIEGIQEKKGKKIISIDLSGIENNITDFFIVCHADSNTHVTTIANYVEETVKKNLKERAWHSEGRDNAQWILLDYSNIVVHVFQKEFRDYYNLEGLWADAAFKEYSYEN